MKELIGSLLLCFFWKAIDIPVYWLAWQWSPTSAVTSWCLSLLLMCFNTGEMRRSGNLELWQKLMLSPTYTLVSWVHNKWLRVRWADKVGLSHNFNAFVDIAEGYPRKKWPGECGPGSMSIIFPQADLQDACRMHDFAYEMGGPKDEFIKLERDFKYVLIATCSTFTLPLAFTYSAFTRVWGWSRWTKKPRVMSKEDMAKIDKWA